MWYDMPIYNRFAHSTARGDILIRGLVGTDCQRRLSGNVRISSAPIDLWADMSHPDNITYAWYLRQEIYNLQSTCDDLCLEADGPNLSAVFVRSGGGGAVSSLRCSPGVVSDVGALLRYRRHDIFCQDGSKIRKSSNLSPRLHPSLLGPSVAEKAQTL